MKIYYKLLFVVISVMLLLLLITFGSLAQAANNPNVNDDANACFEGGVMAGSCDNMDVDKDGDIDQQDKDWMWKCGWYLIRVEYGIYSEEVLDGICLEIIEEVEVVVEKKKKKQPTATPNYQA